MGEVYICIITEHRYTALVVSGSISTDNPIFSGVCNLAVKIGVLLIIWGRAVPDWEQSLFFLYPFFIPFPFLDSLTEEC